MNEQERIESIKWYGGRHLKNFKPENITYNMCLAAVESDGKAIEFVPEAFRTREIYTEACRSNGMLLGMVPVKYHSKKIYELAVQSAGGALMYVPAESKTRKLCRLAALNTPAALNYIPKEYITAELCIESLKAQAKPKWDHATSKNVMTSGLEAFDLIPASVRDSNLCLEMVSLEPELIWLIPKKNRTAAVCKAVIKGFGYESIEEAIQHEPRLISRMHESLCTEQASLAFINSEYFTNAIRFYRNPRQWERRGMKAIVLDNGNFFLEGDEFPLKNILRWRSVAEIAVEKCWRMLEFVPSKTINYDICEKAVKADAYSFSSVPDKYKTKELCMLAFKKEKWNIKYFPEEYISKELCEIAVDNDNFTSVPESFRTKELCLRAIDINSNDVMYVPKDVMDEDIALAAVKKGTGLYHIPKEHITYNVCLEAVKRNSGNIRYVPKELITDELLALTKE